MTTLGTESDGDSLGQDVNTLEKSSATFDAKLELLVGGVQTRQNRCSGGPGRQGGNSRETGYGGLDGLRRETVHDR
ncbi:hypothetical protein BC937DRAFT_91909 [Endogone sp. FLAS-F59071]|nr:hypothetical protein BC937DRAFT_91909 [Endogone sp. FLAS-F59071]|eukprot:RUS21671.1 hypothetical protein BC937DRAFT_91909 [Endogone sp. FLAS-F59071]